MDQRLKSDSLAVLALLKKMYGLDHDFGAHKNSKIKKKESIKKPFL